MFAGSQKQLLKAAFAPQSLAAKPSPHPNEVTAIHSIVCRDSLKYLWSGGLTLKTLNFIIWMQKTLFLNYVSHTSSKHR